MNTRVQNGIRNTALAIGIAAAVARPVNAQEVVTPKTFTGPTFANITPGGYTPQNYSEPFKVNAGCTVYAFNKNDIRPNASGVAKVAEEDCNRKQPIELKAVVTRNTAVAPKTQIPSYATTVTPIQPVIVQPILPAGPLYFQRFPNEVFFRGPSNRPMNFIISPGHQVVIPVIPTGYVYEQPLYYGGDQGLVAVSALAVYPGTTVVSQGTVNTILGATAGLIILNELTRGAHRR